MKPLKPVKAVSDEPITTQSKRYTSPVAPVSKLRVFDPKFKQRTLERIAKAFGLASVDELPPYFRSMFVCPAKIGLAQDLDARFGVAIDKKAYSQRRIALRAYFESFQYRQAILQCEYRMDLELTPAGRVSPDERAHSMKMLYELKQRKLKGNLPTQEARPSPDMEAP